MARTKQTARKSADGKAPSKKHVTTTKSTVKGEEKMYQVTESQITRIVGNIITKKLSEFETDLSYFIAKKIKDFIAEEVPKLSGLLMEKLVSAIVPPTEEVKIMTVMKPDEPLEPKIISAPPKKPSKMTVPKLKAFIEKNKLSLPNEGSGSKGSFLKKDYVAVVINAIGTTAPPVKKPPPKKVPVKKPPAKECTLIVSYNEEQRLYIDEDGNVHDIYTASIIGVVDGEGNVRPLKVPEARSLNKKKCAMWHQKEKKRPLIKVTTKAEIKRLLKKMRGSISKEQSGSDKEENSDILAQTSKSKSPREEMLKEKPSVSPEEQSASDEKEDFDILAHTPESKSPRKLTLEELKAEGGIFEIDSDSESREGSDDGTEESIEEIEVEDTEDIVGETEKSLRKTLKDDPSISKEDFTKYVEIQYLAKVDISDIHAVAKATGLHDDTVRDILLGYKVLKEKYPYVVIRAMKKARNVAGRTQTAHTTSKKKRRLLKKKIK